MGEPREKIDFISDEQLVGSFTDKKRQLHEKLKKVVALLPSDFEPYGDRFRDVIADCSCGCVHWQPLKRLASDWGVCINAKSPRAGLLTFEHQGCPEFEEGD